MAASPVIAPAVAGSEDVDPLAEADLYLNFGRDAQAEEVLKEALAKNPQHEEVQLKLLQIYAGRKDKTEFEKIARNLHGQTAGVGDNWLKAAGMGYAFDPENALYEAGKSAPAAAAPVVGGAAAPGTDLDFDLELSPGAGGVTTTDVALDSDTAEKTTMMQPGELAGMSVAEDDTRATQDITQDSAAARAIAAEGAAATPDFTLNVPAGGGGAAAMVPDLTVDAPAEGDSKMDVTDVTGDSAVPMVSVIDFNFETPAAKPAAPAAGPQEFKHDSTVVMTPENQGKAAPLNMDFDIGGTAPAAPVGTSSVVPLDPGFKLDLGGEAPAAPAVPDLKLDDINLSLDDVSKTQAVAPAAGAGGAKDDHWYDVQTKFDLAKAYQEMGDKDGAREILKEVIKEGDAAQQAEAKQLLDSLG
jgi:pilus assembly protein FimV